ncbi:hypothetical protein I4U23_014458 [Adineta vaga]|nr:hypothetical protein I4U23_014458 [Adineta vaga]
MLKPLGRSICSEMNRYYESLLKAEQTVLVTSISITLRFAYDRNQYDRKHYDADNPSSKVVQGYKFNIFYPVLIDKTKTLTYTPKFFAILKAHGRPPYKDIAFKMVNKS